MGSRIPLFGLGQRSKSAYVTAKQIQNMYVEVRPNGEKSALVAYGTPGETLFVDFGATPCRGGLEFEPGNVCYVVHRGTLWEVNNAGVMTSRGSLLTTTGRVSMSHNGVQVMIVDGTYGYIYNTSTTAFTQNITSVDSDFPADPLTVTFLSRRFIINIADSSRFYCSDIDNGLAWDALNFANAETSPDPIVAVWSSNGQLILLGTLTTEYWGNSGVLDFPFSALQGTAAEWGLAATWSIAKFDNTFAFLVKNRMGQVMWAKLNGYLPEKISTVDMDAITNGYADVADASGYSYMIGGHPMYVLNFPAAERSWLFDGSTGIFTNLKSFGSTRHNAEFSFPFLGNTIVSDCATGRLYRLEVSALTDNGAAIEREIVSENIAAPDLSHLSLDCLRVDMEVGVGLTGQPFDSGVNYLLLPGASGDYASTPDRAALDITADIEFICYAAADDWTPSAAQVFLGKLVTTGNQVSYDFVLNSNGTLLIVTSPTGNAAANVSGTSTASVSATNGSGIWLRGTLDVNDGAGNRVYTFYTSTDPVSTPVASITWTQLGSTVTTAGTTSIFASTSALEIGSIQGGTLNNFDGKIYKALVYNGIGGTLVASFDATTTPAGSPTVVAATGEIYTLQGNASIAGNYVRATQGANPQVGLSISRDNGKTWGPQMMKPMGAMGEYGTRVEWRRLGSPRVASFKLSVSDPVPVNFVSATLNPEN